MAPPSPPPAGPSSREPVNDALRTIDAAFRSSKHVEDADLPLRNYPGAPSTMKKTRGDAPPVASESDYVCARGPCRHYASRVVYFPTKNEDFDGVERSVREHWCRFFREEISEDRVFGCSVWRPVALRRAVLIGRAAWRAIRTPLGWMLLCAVFVGGIFGLATWDEGFHGALVGSTMGGALGFVLWIGRHFEQAALRRLAAREVTATADAPTAVSPLSPCFVCHHAREKSGVPDLALRRASAMGPVAWCWCGEKPEAWHAAGEWPVMEVKP